jgi:hypothetical protein
MFVLTHPGMHEFNSISCGSKLEDRMSVLMEETCQWMMIVLDSVRSCRDVS